MTEFTLAPEVIREATTYIPFRNVNSQTESNFEFDEPVTFVGANLKARTPDSVLELTLQAGEASTNGNAGVKFRTDFWLNNDICAGRVRAADADERDWKNTQRALRVINRIATLLGMQKGGNPIAFLTDAGNIPVGGFVVTIRTFQKSNGTTSWSIDKAVAA